MSTRYDLPRGQFFDEEGRYVNPATVAEKLRQAESEAVKWKARQRSTEQKLGYEEKLRGQAEADLMFRTEQRDDLLKRLEQAEAEARKWKSTAQGLAEELSSRSVEWFIENGGDEADGWSPAQFLARYQPGGES